MTFIPLSVEGTPSPTSWPSPPLGPWEHIAASASDNEMRVSVLTVLSLISDSTDKASRTILACRAVGRDMSASHLNGRGSGRRATSSRSADILS
eukprot:CAMPEP_0183297646 /NCGR_PEP_ID=MMETSP0160_2-20130417/4882_1 /TAXON_ID=2839 ORGANISM="Odontella Sinensis, Strain Grunow 1884" /NCGR_SAMPLE_ID=MMETSP0160_2 /ASSEMBLY_ACC=CAM_ASM_000250 /LENGTH=93 /DNA_ID=CAMNT_0025459513 /DNA_START=305 /DNA_END=582 /DNA_ORIENTATION=-